jgi:hypothetical protein
LLVKLQTSEHAMDDENLPGFDGVAALGKRAGVDMRPTLLRVLTDLYVQQLTHSAEEESRYTELALRLLDTVDEPTRKVVASRLARHLSPPMAVLRRLADDLPKTAEMTAEIAASRSLPPPAVEQNLTAAPPPPFAPAPEPIASTVDAARPLDRTTAAHLNALFFAAAANERRLILCNLEIVAPLPSARPNVARDAALGERLEAAALARKREEFAQLVSGALQIPRAQARHILHDELGEPLVVAAKALGIAREVLYRILLFANPSVGHSVERVHALAALYDEITPQAAQGMVAIWQALDEAERAPATYHPLPYGGEPRPRARPTAVAQNAAAAPRIGERRDAS